MPLQLRQVQIAIARSTQGFFGFSLNAALRLVALFLLSVCSFWRLVKLDRPRPGMPDPPLSILQSRLARIAFITKSAHGKSKLCATELADLQHFSVACLRFGIGRNYQRGSRRLAGVSLIVIPATAPAAATKSFSTPAAAPANAGRHRQALRFGLVDLQSPSAQLRAVQMPRRPYRLLPNSSISTKREAAGASGFANRLRC